MSTGKEQLEKEYPTTDPDDAELTERPAEVAKTNLAKRLTIDALLEERKVQKKLKDYDFDF